MLCDVCKQKKASVFLTQIVSGQMHKVNLCESCSTEKEVTNPTGYGLADNLKKFGQGEKIETQPQERSCPACGIPQTTFRKTGRLGCAKCYSVFGEGMDNLLKAMYAGTKHTGKVPARIARLLEPEARLTELKEALAEAIAGEKFEEAARLRDAIRQLTESV